MKHFFNFNSLGSAFSSQKKRGQRAWKPNPCFGKLKKKKSFSFHAWANEIFRPKNNQNGKNNLPQNMNVWKREKSEIKFVLTSLTSKICTSRWKFSFILLEYIKFFRKHTRNLKEKKIIHAIWTKKSSYEHDNTKKNKSFFWKDTGIFAWAMFGNFKYGLQSKNWAEKIEKV